MKAIIPPIKAIKDDIDTRRDEYYLVSDWVQTKLAERTIPVRVTSIRHNRISVSNSPYLEFSTVGQKEILENLYMLLSTAKKNYSTTTALCAQYAIVLIELDNAIVHFRIDSHILKRASLSGVWWLNYNEWADKLESAGKEWGYKDFKDTDDVCFYNPGFDYELYYNSHEKYWSAFHEKLDALVVILRFLQSLVSNKGINSNITPDTVENREVVYVSYSWADSSEMDCICEALKSSSIEYRRDVTDCGFLCNIKKFEDEISKGKRVIAIIGERYLKSINCMYEICSLAEKGDIEGRLIPIVKSEYKRDLEKYNEIIEFWKEEYSRRCEILQNLQSGTSLQALKELEYCDKIIRELPKLINYLAEYNTLSFDELMSDGCKKLIDYIKASIAVS